MQIQRYTIGKPMMMEKRYFGYTTSFRWEGYELKLEDKPGEKFSVYRTNGGWMVEGEETGQLYSCPRSCPLTQKEAIEKYIKELEKELTSS